jgi:molybdopterin/thiamine biosynthesis adenylyltransferase
MSDAGERLARQAGVFPDPLREQTAMIELCGGAAPNTSRAMKWGAAATGLPAIFSDFHGAGGNTSSFLAAQHPAMVAAISDDCTRYEFLDPACLAADVCDAIREYPRSPILVPLNEPALAYDALSRIRDVPASVLLFLTAKGGAVVELVSSPEEAAARMAPLRRFAPIAEGTTDLAMVAAGSVLHEIIMSRDPPATGARQTLCFYSLHQPQRVNVGADAGLEELVRRIAAPVPGRQRFGNRRLMMIGAGGLAGPLSLAISCSWKAEMNRIAHEPVPRDREETRRGLTVLDHDTVAASNRNRTLVYARDDVGRPKATALAARLQSLDPRGSYSGKVAYVSNAADLGSLAEYDALLVVPDNDLPRIHGARAALAAGIPYVTGATNATAGYLVAQVTGGSCFECQTGIDLARSATRFAARHDRSSSCQEAEPSVCASNMVIAGLMASELAEIFSGRRPRNLRFRGNDVTGNRLACRGGDTTPCSHRGHGAAVSSRNSVAPASIEG